MFTAYFEYGVKLEAKWVNEPVFFLERQIFSMICTFDRV